MVPREGDHPPENSDVSKQYIYQNRPWFQTTGQLSQLIAGSMILASVSLVLDRIDILWQTLYHLLESCTDDFHWILRTFDVFALVSGSKLFLSDNCDLIPMIIKLVVSHLKREMESDKEKACWFSPVREWFMEDELSLDKVGKLLMEELHSLVDDSMKSAVTASSARARNSKEFCEGDCSLQNLARQLEYNVDIRVCSFIDVVSLVELTGRYMVWILTALSPSHLSSLFLTPPFLQPLLPSSHLSSLSPPFFPVSGHFSPLHLSSLSLPSLHFCPLPSELFLHLRQMSSLLSASPLSLHFSTHHFSFFLSI